MLTEQPHSLLLKEETKDSFGNVVATSETSFSGYVEEKGIVEYIGNKLEEVGKGIVFTTASLDFDYGKLVVYRNKDWTIKKLNRYTGLDGEFSHWELVYG